MAFTLLLILYFSFDSHTKTSEVKLNKSFFHTPYTLCWGTNGRNQETASTNQVDNEPSFLLYWAIEQQIRKIVWMRCSLLHKTVCFKRRFIFANFPNWKRDSFKVVLINLKTLFRYISFSPKPYHRRNVSASAKSYHVSELCFVALDPDPVWVIFYKQFPALSPKTVTLHAEITTTLHTGWQCKMWHTDIIVINI